MKKIVTSLLVLSTLSTPAMADIGNVSWHGYVAQGITVSTDSEFITDGNDFTGELTEVGLNGSLQLAPKIRLSGQVVYLDGGNRYRQGTRLDYLFIDWELTQLANWQFNINLGRFKNQHWLFSATRDVPHSRDSIILPQSIYYDGFRDVALSSDGAAIKALHSGQWGSWDINWSLGRSPIARKETKNIISPAARGKAKQDFVHQFSVYWQPPSMDWQLGTSYLDSDFSYDAADKDFLTGGSSSVERCMVSLRYFGENWDFASELIRERVFYNGEFIDGNVLNSDRTGEGGYAQWRYFLPADITLLLRYDTYDIDRNDRNGKALERQTGGLIPAYYGFMDSATVGLSIELTDQLRLRGEFTRSHGAGRLKTVLDPTSLVPAKEYWNMWSMQLMYWF